MSKINLDKRKIYKWFIAGLAIISIILIILDFAALININSPSNKWFWINNTILILLAIDYFYHLYKADNRKQYFKTHIFDLLAIIPVSFVSFWMIEAQIANMALYFRLIRLIRLAGLIGKLREILHTNGILYVIYFMLTFLMLGSIAISITEHVSLDRAFWWAITTASTVGYGDISTDTISPHTLIGKFVILVMILIGVGVMGMITSSLTAYFMRRSSLPNNNENHTEMQLILKKLDDLEKQNSELAKQNRELQMQVQEIKDAHSSTEWKKIKAWIAKHENKDRG